MSNVHKGLRRAIAFACAFVLALGVVVFAAQQAQAEDADKDSKPTYTVTLDDATYSSSYTLGTSIKDSDSNLQRIVRKKTKSDEATVKSFTGKAKKGFLSISKKGDSFKLSSEGSGTITVQYTAGDSEEADTVSFKVKVASKSAAQDAEADEAKVEDEVEAQADPEPELATFTVQFDGSGGYGSMDPQVFTYGVEQALTTCGFEYEGRTFKCWEDPATHETYSDGQTVKNLTDVDGGVVTLVAQWDLTDPVATFTVHFDGNGGDGSMDDQTFTSGVEQALTANAFTFAGHSFNGWNTAADGSGTAYTDEQAITIDAGMTLYAQWEEEPEPTTYTVKFNGNGGAGTMADQIFTEGVEQALSPNEFTLDGAEFAGWNTKKDGSGDSYGDGESITVSQNMTLYATWSAIGPPVSYVVVSFDANGGTGTMADQEVPSGEATALNANKFTRSGYSFTGWNTKKDGSGTAYADGAEITTSKNVTLYAQWKKNASPKIVTPKPEIVSSAAGKIISQKDEVTFTITQKVPADATAMTIRYDLNSAMGFTTDAKSVVVGYANKSSKNAGGTEYVTSIDGQKLSVAFADAKGIRGETIKVICKAKVKSSSALAPFLNEKKTTALLPYQARTDFKGAKDRTATSESKTVKVAYSNSSSRTASRRGTLARTGDPSSLAAIATLAGTGILTAWTGHRMRKHY